MSPRDTSTKLKVHCHVADSGLSSLPTGRRAIPGNKEPSHGKAMESYFMYSSEDTNVRKSLPNAGHARERGFENTILRHNPVVLQKETEMSIDISQDGALETDAFAVIS